MEVTAMKTKDLMIPNPITVKETASIQDAIELMKTNAIRHLPVVGPGKVLKGFVTLADLKQGLLPSMLGDLGLKDLMVKRPITVAQDDDIELAARKIYKHKIGGMPVIDGDTVVGIITETDILRAFIDMLGILTASARIEVTFENDPKTLQKAIAVIHEAGGDIINITTSARQTKKKTYTIRLPLCDTKDICRALSSAGFDVINSSD